MPFESRTSIRRVVTAHGWAALMAAALLTAGCADGLFTPNQTGSRPLQLQPVRARVGAFASIAADVNVIRLTLVGVPARNVLSQQEFSVDPAADEWLLPVEAPVSSELEVNVELVNRGASGDVVVYSGRVLIKTGLQPAAAVVQVYPGPLDNLDVTSLTIAPRGQGVLEGETVQLTANIGGTSKATVFWSSSNTSVATVVDGLVQAIAPGHVTIEAVAGPKSDAVTIDVGARAVTVRLTPAEVTLYSLGADATFSAVALDARGTEVAGLPVEWRIADATIATPLAPGVFRATRSGQTTVEASITQGAHLLSGSATLKVEQRPAKILVTPPAADLASLGEVVALTASAVDSAGRELTDAQFAWHSSDENVATVDQSGNVTAVSNGVAFISAELGGVSGEANVTVAQVPASIYTVPQSITLQPGQVAHVTAYVTDARGNAMSAAVQWSVRTGSSVASVSQNGDVTALASGHAVVVAEAAGLQASVDVTVSSPTPPPTPAGDIIIYTDLNVFDESPNTPSNLRMLSNLVTFGGSGPRASQTHVWLDFASPTNCAFCGNTFAFMRGRIAQDGLVVDSITSGSGNLAVIPDVVKAIFLYVPNVTFSAAEVQALKDFLGAGGRLVLIGGHGGSNAELPFLNTMLTRLGSTLQTAASYTDCGRSPVPATSLRPHQVTAGMTEFRPGCTAALSLGLSDIGLIYDSNNTFPIVAATRAGGQN